MTNCRLHWQWKWENGIPIGLYVFVCFYLLPFGDRVHEKGHYQLGQGERSLKGVRLSQRHKKTWLFTNHFLSCRQLCSRALRFGWGAMKRYPRTIPGPPQEYIVLPGKNVKNIDSVMVSTILYRLVWNWLQQCYGAWIGNSQKIQIKIDSSVLSQKFVRVSVYKKVECLLRLI